MCSRWIQNEQICMSTHKLLFCLHACRQSSSSLLTVTLLRSTRDPWGWWLAELPSYAILTDWPSMCYTAINDSNYQWARLWTLQTEVNKHNRFWGSLRGWGWDKQGSSVFTKGLCLALSLTGKVDSLLDNNDKTGRAAIINPHDMNAVASQEERKRKLEILDQGFDCR